MSRPASCSAVYGLRPGTGCVVERWKKSGTISTRPPIATTRMISTIIRKLLVSMRSCEKAPTGLSWSAMVCLSGFRGSCGQRRGSAGGAGRHREVPGHHAHAHQVQQAAEEAQHVERICRLHALDEAVDQRAVRIDRA